MLWKSYAFCGLFLLTFIVLFEPEDHGALSMVTGILPGNRGTLQCEQGSPSIYEVNPDTAMIGQSVVLTIKGHQTHFLDNPTSSLYFAMNSYIFCLFYPVSVTVINDSTMEAMINPTYSLLEGWYALFYYNDMDSVMKLNNAVYISYLVAGVNESEKSDGISVYPNPGKGIFHLINRGKAPVESVSVYNFNGQRINPANKEDDIHHQTIYLLNQDAGVYYLKIQIHGRIFIRKVILQ